MSDHTYLVTGSMGCIGSWVLKHLVERGHRIVATDLGDDPVRPGLIMTDEILGTMTWRQLDVTDTKAVADVVSSEGVDRIIHLAGLQIPFCKANPALGAAVNVDGTVNVFEAARAAGIKSIAYASSIAVLGPAGSYDTYPLDDSVLPNPSTLYGVYKVANEGTARIYAQDWGVGSIGLRPHSVFGIGRDQGVTADFAKAILAAAIGKPFHIRFGGQVSLHHASDVAQAFIDCADAQVDGAFACNQRYDVMSVGDFVEFLTDMVPGAQITFDADTPLPVDADLDDSGLRALIGDIQHTPLRKSISQDIDMYKNLVAANKIDLTQLDR
ncbi:MAG: NAD(P)-dependent oxidoreductase [Silicimonas sp.]|nr:NAD(P)-dependent oxidoreductase [Silicimonas sp.]